MNCPRCGYVCSELDTLCLRCRLMAAQDRPRPVVSPAEQTIVMSDLHWQDDISQTLVYDAFFAPERPLRLSGGWLTAVLVCLALLVGFLVWRHAPSSHAPAPVHLTTSVDARAVSG